MATKRTGTTFRRPDEIFTHLGKAPLYPLYLFHGDESYFINRAVGCVHKTLGQDVAVHTFYAGEDALDADRHLRDADLDALDLHDAILIVSPGPTGRRPVVSPRRDAPALRSARIMSEAFSASAMVGALVLPATIEGAVLSGQRAARLALLARVRDAVHSVADFSKITG